MAFLATQPSLIRQSRSAYSHIGKFHTFGRFYASPERMTLFDIFFDILMPPYAMPPFLCKYQRYGAMLTMKVSRS